VNSVRKPLISCEMCVCVQEQVHERCNQSHDLFLSRHLSLFMYVVVFAKASITAIIAYAGVND